MIVTIPAGQQYKILEEPSSEAESLSHVASGIATSLGLVSTEHGEAITPDQQDKKVLTKADMEEDWDT